MEILHWQMASGTIHAYLMGAPLTMCGRAVGSGVAVKDGITCARCREQIKRNESGASNVLDALGRRRAGSGR
jgi:hypothetical protein